MGLPNKCVTDWGTDNRLQCHKLHTDFENISSMVQKLKNGKRQILQPTAGFSLQKM
jgi:hypothetical protein